MENELKTAERIIRLLKGCYPSDRILGRVMNADETGDGIIGTADLRCKRSPDQDGGGQVMENKLENELKRITPIGQEMYSFVCTHCGDRFREPDGMFVKMDAEPIMNNYCGRKLTDVSWQSRVILCERCNTELHLIMHEFCKYEIGGTKNGHD